MKNISKKVLALALSFSMIVTLLPTQAIAEEEENVSVAMESEEVYNEEISLDDTDDNTEILQSAVDEDSQSEETIIDMPSEDAETSTDSAETDTNNSSEEQAITTSFMMDGAILTDGVAEEEENAAVVTESEAAFDESDDEETVLVDVDESTGITESVDDKDDISEEILTDTVSDSSETKSNLASEDQAALTAESEAVTYSYRYKIYTWNDTTFNFYRPYKTVSNVTSTSATVSIPTGSISLANVTINEEEYKPVGWTVSSSNYTVLRTEATCEVGDNITTDISELASNKYVEVFAVYEKVITEYTVTFNSNGGSEVESQTVKEGETAKEPTEPTLDGYTFAGWYSDAELTTAYDFSTSVSSDVTLYAKWEEEAKETAYDEEVVIGSEGSTYTWVQYIVYHTNYPDGTDATYTVKYTIYSNSSSKSGKLKTYAECGYTLPEGYSLRDSKYWNSSADGSTAYYSSSFNFLNGNDGLVKDLYAIYTKNTYTITFNSNGGSEVESQSVAYGDAVTEPEEPTLSGYTFAGWYSDAELTEKYDFSIAVTGDTILYAKWEAVLETESDPIETESEKDAQNTETETESEKEKQNTETETEAVETESETDVQNTETGTETETEAVESDSETETGAETLETETETETQTETSEETEKAVETEDNSPIFLYVVFMIYAAAILCLGAFWRKKRNLKRF